VEVPLHQQITGFIQTRFRAAIGSRNLTSDTPLFSNGIIDSFGVLELIAFLDDAFGVDIDPSRYELRDFDNIDKIVVLVKKLKGDGR
jgi:acyl carrier protein